MLRKLSIGYMIIFITTTFSVGLLGADNSRELIRFDSDHFRATGYLPQGVSLEQLEDLLRNSSGLKSVNEVNEVLRNDAFIMTQHEKELFWVTPSIRDKRDYTYDGENYLTEMLEQKWEDSDWVNNLHEVITYDENQMLDYGSFFVWNSNEWQEGNVYTNSYNDEDQLITQVYTYQGNNYFQNLYTYDEAGHMVEQLTQVWDVSQEWRDNMRAIYGFDENYNQVLLETHYHMSGTWVIAERIISTYDENGRWIEDLVQLYEADEWMDYYHSDLVYDENGVHVQTNGYIMRESGWDNNRLITFNYDENLNNVEILMDASYDGGDSWVDFIHEMFLFQPALSIEADHTLTPDHMELKQNYPNPFNPSTTLRYGLTQNTLVSLDIYDVKGNMVQTLTSGSQSAGWYEANWNGTRHDGSPATTGVYFAQLRSGETNQVVKMLLIK